MEKQQLEVNRKLKTTDGTKKKKKVNYRLIILYCMS